MARITLADLAQDEVELPGGHVYTIAPATRAVITKANGLDERLEQVDDSDLDGIVELYAEVLSLRLHPAGKGQPHAGTIAKQLWKADKVTLPQLQHLLSAIHETDRPT